MTTTAASSTPHPADEGQTGAARPGNDLALRGVPDGTATPQELEALHPEKPFLLGYSRISDDWRQHNKRRAENSAWAAGKGVANQHRRNDANARRHGCIIVRRYTDNDLSASKRSVRRPDFEQLLQDLERGRTPEGYRADGVIVVDQDRLQRTDSDWERFVEALTGRPERRLWTPSGPSDLTEEGEIIKTGVMALINKAESLKKKRRIRDWHQDRIIDGLPHSGPRPFGWEDDKLTLCTPEADFLRWAIEERIRGKSLGTLCAEAARRGLRGTRGGTLVPVSLAQMMTAPRVCGYRANKGELVRDGYGEPIVGVWSPIVTPEQWDAVCATLGPGSTYLARGAGAPRITGQPKTVKYLASGLLRCNVVVNERVCNVPMHGSRSSRSRRSPYNYQCPQGRGCGRNAISGPVVDRALTHLLLTKLSQMEATYTPREHVWPDTAELEEQTRKLRSLEASWQSPDGVTDEMFFRLAPRLEQEIRRLQAGRARWERENAEDDGSPGEIRRRWATGEYDLSQKRRLLFKVFAAVRVDRGRKGCRVPDPRRLRPVWNSTASLSD